jgi:drug/metabolite transporter (DMT)-like permease
MVLGITQALMSMASIVAPVLSGVLIEHGMLTAWAWAAAALASVGVFLTRDGWAASATASAEAPSTP